VSLGGDSSSDILPEFPGNKWSSMFTSGTAREVVEERRLKLESYLKQLVCTTIGSINHMLTIDVEAGAAACGVGV
jgi:hypothetical protein